MHISRHIPGRIPRCITRCITRYNPGCHPSKHGTPTPTTGTTSSTPTTTNALHLDARCHRSLTRKFPKFSLTAVKVKLASDTSRCRCRDKHRRGTARSPPTTTVDWRAASTMTGARRPRSRTSRDATRCLLRFPHTIVRVPRIVNVVIVIVMISAIRRPRPRTYT